MLLSTRQTVLSLLLRTAPAGYTRPANLNTLSFGLFTTMPADDGTGGVEAAGSSYARVNVSALDANFSIANDVVTNVADIVFPTLTGDIGTVVGWGIWDAGNVLRWAQPAGALPLGFTHNGATDTLTRNTHGLADKQPVRAFPLDGLPLPGGLALNTTYYVRDSGANSMKLAATEAGAAIDLTTDGAVSLRRWSGKAYGFDDKPVIPAGFVQLQLRAA